MKGLLVLSAVFMVSSLAAQSDSLTSRLIEWSNLKIEKTSTGVRRNLMKGFTTHLKHLEIHTTTIAGGKSPHAPHAHIELEELIIVKNGTLKITIKDSTNILGSGSIAVAMPGDFHGIVNVGKDSATYYVIRYQSKAAVDTNRAVKAGGSILINWDGTTFKPATKGGSRAFFERPTGMLQRMEMHVTTLHEGFKSHDPHTHAAEEIILVISGEVDMQLGDSTHRARMGDLIFVSSGLLHAPKNAGTGQCSYFAIQLQ